MTLLHPNDTTNQNRDERGRFAHTRQDASGFELAPASSVTDAVARAADPNTSASDLIALSYSKNARVREAVIDNPSTPADVLRRYLDLGIHQRARILRSPALTRDDLREIAEGRDRRNNTVIARLDNIDDETMAACAATDVISATVIASREDAPAWLLAQLAGKSNARQVLITLTENRRSPQSVRAIAATRSAELLAALNADQ
jgi:hypothetical protein